MPRHLLALPGCVLAATLWLATPRCAFACTCVPPEPPVAAMAQADSGFAGRVVTVEERSNSLAVTIAVATVWKGRNAATITVYTAPDGGSCGGTFEADKRSCDRHSAGFEH